MPIAKSDHSIQSLLDWERLAPPKSPHHWLDGRSAKEVARAWLENGLALPSEVESALASHPGFGPVLSWDAEPEARLPFDSFAGEQRNSDLLVLARDARGPYVLAVESKADESYGETIADAFADALERRIANPRSNGIARIEGLVSLLLGARQPGHSKAADLRYQLFTACAGAIAEADRRGCSRAVMLVHEFVTAATSDANHERNAADLQKFLARLDGDSASIPGAVLHGPFVHTGSKGVQLFIGKVSRNIRNSA